MTDRERFLQLCKDFGIDVVTSEDKVGYGLIGPPKNNDVRIVALMGTRVLGYADFFCEWYFYSDGRFDSVGIWE